MFVQIAENRLPDLITMSMVNHSVKNAGGIVLESQKWTGTSVGAGNAYKKVQEKRKELRKEHKLGFQKPVRTQRGKGNSIVSTKISKLSNEEFALLKTKIGLLPEKKRVEIKRDWTQPLTTVLGTELAHAIIEAKPDMKKIIMLADPIPDIEKRITSLKKRG
jgi:hypothetical protein